MKSDNAIKHIMQFIGVVLLAMLAVLLLSVLFGWNPTRLYSVLCGRAADLADTEVPQLVLKQISVLIAMIGVGFAAIYFNITTRLKKIETIEEIHRNAIGLTGILVESIIYELPPLSYTQHIPFEQFKIFKKIQHVLKLSDRFNGVSEANSKVLVGYAQYFVRGIICFCIGEYNNTIDSLLQAAKTADSADMKVQALWRLGIAYRQTKRFREARDLFEELEKDKGGNHCGTWGLALKGQILTDYAEYKSANNYQISVWGNSANRRDLLESAEEHIDVLCSQGFLDTQFVSFYGALIKIELGKDPVTEGGENLLHHTVNESLVEGKLYPHSEDYAVQADFYLSIAMCYEYLRRKAAEDKNGDDEAKYRYKRDDCGRRAEICARRVQSDYNQYKMIYSEKQLREVTANTFISELREWLV